MERKKNLGKFGGFHDAVCGVNVLAAAAGATLGPRSRRNARRARQRHETEHEKEHGHLETLLAELTRDAVAFTDQAGDLIAAGHVGEPPPDFRARGDRTVLLARRFASLLAARRSGCAATCAG